MSPASVWSGSRRSISTRWNRDYPANYFPVDLSVWNMETKEFAGSSHREEYQRAVYPLKYECMIGRMATEQFNSDISENIAGCGGGTGSMYRAFGGKVWTAIESMATEGNDHRI